MMLPAFLLGHIGHNCLFNVSRSKGFSDRLFAVDLYLLRPATGNISASASPAPPPQPEKHDKIDTSP
jgi:hypothetical protein